MLRKSMLSACCMHSQGSAPAKGLYKTNFCLLLFQYHHRTAIDFLSLPFTCLSSNSVHSLRFSSSKSETSLSPGNFRSISRFKFISTTNSRRAHHYEVHSDRSGRRWHGWHCKRCDKARPSPGRPIHLRLRPRRWSQNSHCNPDSIRNGVSIWLWWWQRRSFQLGVAQHFHPS